MGHSSESAPLYRYPCCAASVPGVRVLDAGFHLNNDQWVAQWTDEQTTLPADMKADRFVMRQVLMKGIEHYIHFGKQLLAYTLLPDGRVRCRFDDGSLIKADLLVISNGAASSFTADHFPGTILEDTGDICVYGKLPLPHVPPQPAAAFSQQATTVIFDNDIAAIIDDMHFSRQGTYSITHPEDYIYWALIGKRSRFALSAGQALQLSSPAQKACVHEATGSWHPALSGLYAATSDADISIVPVRYTIQGKRVQPGPVTVLGDAIHTMSPAAGFGANTALRDAAVLTGYLQTTLSNKGSLSAALAGYEKEMLHYSAAAITASRQGSTALYNAAN